MKRLLLLCFFAAALMYALPGFACTTIIVGKKATTDGSVLVSHSEDGLGDPRMIYVPAMDHEPGAMRPVFYSDCALGYKARYGADAAVRLITNTRGPGYNQPGQPSTPLGYIPQVAHTYAYFDGNYGVINEHQLALGECTDKAKVDDVEPEPGKRIFYSAELGRVALERCKKAREAIKLMGELIAKYGYYGTGETLLVADPDEAWVMEMCNYDKDGSDGVWVAQRVPDDHFFVAANQFRIREIQQHSSDMMYSRNVFSAAKSKGWWKPSDGPLDWTKVYGDGEYHHPYYSLRRVWRAMSLAAPSLNLPAWVEGALTKAYPFSIKPDNKMNVKDVFNIHQDTYAGTEFDLSKGLAAGPFGDVVRYEGGSESTMAEETGPGAKGAFERPLSIYRCIYCYVNQIRKNLPDAIGGVTWMGFDRPATSSLQPFHVGVVNLPPWVQRGDAMVFDRGSMWTAFNYVANYATIKYDYMIQDIAAMRDKLEALAFGDQAALEAKALELWNGGDQMGARLLLTRWADAYAKQVLESWWKLSEDLYIKYNDGYINTREELAKQLFYPDGWLEKVGYPNGPTSYEKRAGEH